MMEPLVSICVPTYNGSQYITDAIESAMRQTIDPKLVEIVVSDSGSTDDTIERVCQHTVGSSFPVRILDQRTPGMVRNWNASVRAARGKYIKFLFQDDLLAATCVERMLHAAEAEPNVAMVFCRRELLIDAAAEHLPTAKLLRRCEHLHLGFSRLKPLQAGVDLLGDRRLLMAPINKVGEPTVVLLNRQKLLTIGAFNERMKQLVDLEMWLRMMAVGDVAFLNETLATFRVHAEQATAKNFVTDADEADFHELCTRLSQPDLYRLLHVATRFTVRKSSEEEPRRSVGTGVIDRSYALARAAVHLGRKLKTRRGTTA